MDGMNFAPTAPLRLAGARMAGFNPAAKLANLVESEVIPRLLLSRRANPADRRPSAAHVETLARLALSRDPGAAAAQVMSLRETGMPVEVLLNDLITRRRAASACSGRSIRSISSKLRWRRGGLSPWSAHWARMARRLRARR